MIPRLSRNREIQDAITDKLSRHVSVSQSFAKKTAPGNTHVARRGHLQPWPGKRTKPGSVPARCTRQLWKSVARRCSLSVDGENRQKRTQKIKKILPNAHAATANRAAEAIETRHDGRRMPPIR